MHTDISDEKALGSAPLQAEARQLVSRGIEDQIAQLRRLDSQKRFRELAIFLSLWIVGMAGTEAAYKLSSVFIRIPAIITATILMAIALNAFVLLMHEGMHHTLFANRFWNRWVSVMFGGTALISFTAYQVLHTRHHNYLGDRGDPDDYHNYTDSRLLVWLLHYMRLLVGLLIYLVLIPAMALRHATPAERRKIISEYMLIALSYTLLVLAAPHDILVHVCVAPLVIVGYMVSIRGLTQHALANARDPFLASRSLITRPLVTFCLLNENFHLEHHLFPEVPSYNLARLHRLIHPRLPRVVTSTSYLGFIARFIRASMKLDETPVGLKEMSDTQ